MGEVYRAHDTRLNRDVAIKILPEAFVRDPERVARFEREARLLAALNHPNIAGIYGLDEAVVSAGSGAGSGSGSSSSSGPGSAPSPGPRSGGPPQTLESASGQAKRFLVLELVEGNSLAAKLAGSNGAGVDLPLDEALSIARQIADALEAAHEKGIVHRDLKPSNIALTPDGKVKVLDFGLAKAIEGSVSGDVANSPTVTVATRAGLILGTAAYMSPEQAKGRAADKRSDVWGFGCVLYEMLAGKRAFNGEDVSDTLAAVLRDEPDWTAVPAAVPPQVQTLVRRCLVKDRASRISDISVARFLLTETVTPAAHSGLPQLDSPTLHRRRTRDAAAGLMAGMLLMAVIAWIAVSSRPAPQSQTMRFVIVPPPGQPVALRSYDRELAISRDGTRLVYTARDGNEVVLMVRAIDQLVAMPLRGTGVPRAPFISPDGKWIGYFFGDELRKVPMTGGAAIMLCKSLGPPRGASWSPDGTSIVFATGSSTGLLRVSAEGGEPTELTKVDPANKDQKHWFPFVLGNGKAVLFTVNTGAGIANSDIAVLDLESKEYKILVRGGSNPEYAATGHLVYAVEGALRAVRFDADRLEVLGAPAPVVEQVTTMPTGAANYALADNGTLVYLTGGVSRQVARNSLVWVTRQGREEKIPTAPERAYLYPRLSPDGTRIALDVRDQEEDIWVWDFGQKLLTRLTFDRGSDQYPVWTPDGRRIIFGSARAGTANLYSQLSDGTGKPERLTTSVKLQHPQSISPDGVRIVYREEGGATGVDLMALVQNGERPGEPLVVTPAAELNAEVSPNGRWLAYESNESGQHEIYVRPFPQVDGGRWQISTAGGTHPLWSRNGRELFFLDPNHALFAVAVQTTGAFSTGNPRKLLDSRYIVGPGRTYDVSLDGQRFLMIKSPLAEQTAASGRIVVVLNWFEELKARAAQ
jgi:serine/threonine protein kinase/Tol biopolymer transport system component